MSSFHLGQWKLSGRGNLCDKEVKVLHGPVDVVTYVSVAKTVRGKLFTDSGMQNFS
jgi:hypothetical protein